MKHYAKKNENYLFDTVCDFSTVIDYMMRVVVNADDIAIEIHSL